MTKVLNFKNSHIYGIRAIDYCEANLFGECLGKPWKGLPITLLSEFDTPISRVHFY
ncbi:hypothetical protein EMIT0P4_140064 [Pseudomonas sp. IT-P4]